MQNYRGVNESITDENKKYEYHRKKNHFVLDHS